MPDIRLLGLDDGLFLPVHQVSAAPDVPGGFCVSGEERKRRSNSQTRAMLPRRSPIGHDEGPRSFVEITASVHVGDVIVDVDMRVRNARVQHYRITRPAGRNGEQ